MPVDRRISTTRVKEAVETFRPLFAGTNVEEGKADGAIPIETLKNYIDDNELAHFPRQCRSSIYKKYDVNRDGLISMEEFEQLMLGEREYFDYSKLSGFKRWVFEFTANVVPNSRKKEYLDEYNCLPPPFAMILISLAEIGVFIYQAIKLSSFGVTVGPMSGIDADSRIIYNPARRYEAWRYITYLFLHVGYTHLLANLIFQLFVGIPLEMVHKWWRVTLIYIFGTVAGSLAHSVFDSGSFLAGASGGAYAIATAHIANVIMNWEELQAKWTESFCRFISSAPVRLTIIIVIGAVDTGIALYTKYGTSSGSDVGIAAHAGGMLAGLLLGIPILRNLDVKRWEKVVQWVAIGSAAALFLFGVLWNIFASDFFPATDWKPLDNEY